MSLVKDVQFGPKSRCIFVDHLTFRRFSSNDVSRASSDEQRRRQEEGRRRRPRLPQVRKAILSVDDDDDVDDDDVDCGGYGNLAN